MKTKLVPTFLAILIIALLLSSCVGGSGTVNSWPGFATDAENQVVYLANGKHVYAIDLSNTIASTDEKDPTPKYQMKWRFPLEPDNKINFFAAPVLTPDGQLLAGSYNHKLYSLNPANGQTNWTFEDSTSTLVASPLVSNGRIFLPSSDYNLYVLDLKGKLLWQYETGNALWATPVSDGDTVYQASMDHHIYALDVKTGRLVWKSEDLDGPIAGQPTLGPEGVLYAGTFNKALLAIDTQTGKIKWQQPLQGWGWTGPLIDNNAMYFGDLAGYLYAKEAGDGSNIWQPVQPPAQQGQKADIRAVPERPLLKDGVLYYASEVGSIYSADPQAGNPKPFFSLANARLYTGPQAAGDLILVAPFGSSMLLIALDSAGNSVADFVPPK